MRTKLLTLVGIILIGAVTLNISYALGQDEEESYWNKLLLRDTEDEAVEIALNDTRVQEILGDSFFETSVDYYVGMAKVIFTFGPVSIESFTADRLLVSVDLENGKVIDVLLMSLRFLRQGPQITESHLGQALEIVLSDPYVQELLSGKEYKILGIQGLRGEPDSIIVRIGAHIYIKFDKNYSFKGDFPGHPSDIIKTYYLDTTISELQITVNIEEELVGQIYPRIVMVRHWFLEPYAFIIGGMMLLGLLIGLGLYFAMRKAGYRD